MSFKNIMVAGSGVLGYQIAFQTAYFGFKVTVYDINDDVLAKAKAKYDLLCLEYKKDVNATDAQLKATFDNLRYCSNLAEALQDIDLVIEAVPESLSIKHEFYKNIGELAPSKTIFASNSSTFLPSKFAKDTGRPGQFLALHFANEIWKHNTAEIMGHPNTDPKVFDEVVAFAKAIGMIALPLQKEQPGYILNSVLVPWLEASMNLVVTGVAEPQTIDKTWMIATGAPTGPFGILDMIGITTVYNINKMGAEATKNPLQIKAVNYLKEHFIDPNKLGISTGEGFYTYPNPAFLDKDFLK